MNHKKMKDPIFQLCDIIREESFKLHKYLRHGHIEKVYENGLLNRLNKVGIVCAQQIALPVFDEDGTSLGNFHADLLINNVLIVELKACRALCNEHVAQLIGYLRASRIEDGLLINFGSHELQIKKYALSKR